MCVQGAEHDCAVEECGGKSERVLNETTESSEKDQVYSSPYMEHHHEEFKAGSTTG